MSGAALLVPICCMVIQLTVVITCIVVVFKTHDSVVTPSLQAKQLVCRTQYLFGFGMIGASCLFACLYGALQAAWVMAVNAVL